MNKSKYVKICNLIYDAFAQVNDILVENKAETIVAFSIGNTLGSTYERLDQMLKDEIEEEIKE